MVKPTTTKKVPVKKKATVKKKAAVKKPVASRKARTKTAPEQVLIEHAAFIETVNRLVDACTIMVVMARHIHEHPCGSDFCQTNCDLIDGEAKKLVYEFTELAIGVLGRKAFQSRMHNFSLEHQASIKLILDSMQHQHTDITTLN